MSEAVALAFRFCPRCGVAAETIGDNPLRCLTCDFTYFFGPVTAVAGVICDPVGRVLFLRRQRNPGKGKLGLPGGFVDAGESVEVALRREALEEVNLRVSHIEYLGSFPNQYTYKNVILPVTDIFFSCKVESFDGMAAEQSEIAGWHFCDPDESTLAEMAFESNRKAVEEFVRRNASRPTKTR